MVTNKNKISLLKNISSMGIVQIANYVFPLITIPIVTRIIGPDKFGVINFAASFVAYFTLLIGFGFDLTATRKVSSDASNEENRNLVFSQVFITQCLLLLLSIIIFLIFLFKLPQLEKEKTVAVYTFITCLATVMTQNWLFQAMQDLPKVAILSLISKTIFTILVLTLVRTKQDYIWQPLALSSSQLITATFSFSWSIKKYKLKLQSVKVIDCFKLLWNERIIFYSLCLINLYSNTNIVVLGILKNSSQVGYYTSGQKLITIFQSIITFPLTQAFYPYIGKAFAQCQDQGIKIVQKLLQIVFLLMFFAGISIIIGAPLFVKIFYGEAFLPAILVCRILAFVPLFTTTGTICGIFVMMNLKMDKSFLKVITIGASVNITSNLLLVNQWGYIGTAVSWAVTEAVNVVFSFIILHKRNIHLFNKNIISFRNLLDFPKIT